MRIASSRSSPPSATSAACSAVGEPSCSRRRAPTPSTRSRVMRTTSADSDGLAGFAAGSAARGFLDRDGVRLDTLSLQIEGDARPAPPMGAYRCAGGPGRAPRPWRPPRRTRPRTRAAPARWAPRPRPPPAAANSPDASSTRRSSASIATASSAARRTAATGSRSRSCPAAAARRRRRRGGAAATGRRHERAREGGQRGQLGQCGQSERPRMPRASQHLGEHQQVVSFSVEIRGSRPPA